MTKQTAKIDKWYVIFRENSYALCGYVFNHPIIGDNHFIITTDVEEIKDGKFITLNTEYTPLNFDNNKMVYYELYDKDEIVLSILNKILTKQ